MQPASTLLLLGSIGGLITGVSPGVLPVLTVALSTGLTAYPFTSG